MRLFLFLFVCLLFMGNAAAAPLPPANVLGAGLGVQLRAGDIKEKDLDAIKETGFSYIRTDMGWGGVERRKGHYDWNYFDWLVAALKARHLKAVFILSGATPFYSPMVEPIEGRTYFGAPSVRAAPSTPQARQAFANFAAAAAERYKDNGIIWEIWNEPDTWNFWPPAADPAAYAALAGQACRAIRTNDPTATVIGPTSARIYGVTEEAPQDFLAPLLASPEALCFDAISVHTHRWHEPPETVEKDYAKAKAYISARTAAGQKPLPLVNSEWGYADTFSSPDQRAAYAVRMHLLNALNDIPLTIWYEWKNSRLGYAGADEPENHFGLVDSTGKAKPAQKALLSFLANMKGAVVEGRLPVAEKNVYIVLVRRPNGQRGALVWSGQDEMKDQTEIKIESVQKTQRIELSLLPRFVEIEDGPVKGSVVKKEK